MSDDGEVQELFEAAVEGDCAVEDERPYAERARRVAPAACSSKARGSTNKGRRERTPWSEDEEEALEEGHGEWDRVSTFLAVDANQVLFGRDPQAARRKYVQESEYEASDAGEEWDAVTEFYKEDGTPKKRFGHEQKWRFICDRFFSDDAEPARNPVDLKDKWRNMTKRNPDVIGNTSTATEAARRTGTTVRKALRRQVADFDQRLNAAVEAVEQSASTAAPDSEEFWLEVRDELEQRRGPGQTVAAIRELDATALRDRYVRRAGGEQQPLYMVDTDNVVLHKLPASSHTEAAALAAKMGYANVRIRNLPATRFRELDLHVYDACAIDERPSLVFADKDVPVDPRYRRPFDVSLRTDMQNRGVLISFS